MSVVDGFVRCRGILRRIRSFVSSFCYEVWCALVVVCGIFVAVCDKFRRCVYVACGF
ncbi:MAG: hypothetical protein ACI4QM_05165 [Alphaproteobacteria bacterium]